MQTLTPLPSLYMTFVMNQNRIIVVIALIALASLSRLLPHAPNFTPILAMALFAGAKISNRLLSTALPVLAMLISDAFIGFHATLPFVYLGMIACVILGWSMQKKVTAAGTAGRSLVGAMNFFVISNLGVWLMNAMYPKTLAGLTQCFAMAIPFFHYTVLSTLLYSAVLFIGFEWAEKRLHLQQDNPLSV